jgi:hypothetical protein
VGVYLAARRLCLVRLGRGVRPRLLRAEQHPVAAQSAGWEASLAALHLQFAKAEWSNAALRIVIADQWARYALVPWSDHLHSDAERLLHARELLTGIYGDSSADWKVSLSAVPPGSACLACAIPTALLEAAQAASAAHGLRLKSVQTQLVAAYNSCRHRLAGAENAWFVTIEEGMLAALRAGSGGINRVHVMRIGADWARELKRLQTLSRLARVSPADGRVYLDVPRNLRPTLAASTESLEWLEEVEPGPTTLQQLEYLRRKSA